MVSDRLALVVLCLLFLPACGLIDGLMNDPVSQEPIEDDAGMADAGMADVERRDSGEEWENACGGEEELVFDGRPAELGDQCGVCDDGLLACDGANALRCSQATVPNECGGCEPLEGRVGEGCGNCNSGTWQCNDDRSMECVGAADDYNVCGGCTELPGTPLFVCDNPEGGQGAWRCTGPEDMSCLPSQQNPCGGTPDNLEHEPGTACGPCNKGTWTCAGPNTVVCNNEDFDVNDCGGCETIYGLPGDECGSCDGGVFTCTSPNETVCSDGDEANAC